MKTFVIALIIAVFCLKPTQAKLIAEVYTSQGNFSIDLNYIGARRTVSHFYRLAVGLQPWLDEKTGELRQGVEFYNGLKFYKRVDQGPPFYPAHTKYIQAGARYPGDDDVYISDAGQGAGYVLRDEIRRNVYGAMLAPHSQYTVSMANTGPNTSSSQFFINITNGTSWDGRNSAFGTVLQQFTTYNENGQAVGVSNGRAVVNAILTAQYPATINRIEFRITENTPPEFDSSVSAAELPTLVKHPIASLTHTPAHVMLAYAPLLKGYEMRQMASADLLRWLPAPTVTQYVPANSSPTVSINHGGRSHAFYRSTAAIYPVSTVPANLLGKKIRIAHNIPNSSPTVNIVQLSFNVDTVSNAYYQYSDGATGTFTYTLKPMGPYHADLVVIPDGFASRTYRLYFGGMNADVSENEQMHATILSDVDPPTEARWFYVP